MLRCEYHILALALRQSTPLVRDSIRFDETGVGLITEDRASDMTSRSRAVAGASDHVEAANQSNIGVLKFLLGAIHRWREEFVGISSAGYPSGYHSYSWLLCESTNLGLDELLIP